MKTTIINIRENVLKEEFIDFCFSFKPFINYLKQRVEAEQTIKSEFYRFVLNKFRAYPHLHQDNLTTDEVKNYTDVLELVYTILSPAVDKEDKLYWAMSLPVPSKIVYSTDAFFSFINDHNARDLSQLSDDNFAVFHERQVDFVYRLILQKLYKFPSDIKNDMIYSQSDVKTKLTQYFKIHTDTNFIDIGVEGKLPELSAEVIEPFLYEGAGMDVLRDVIPLSLFKLEGFSVITIEDITAEQAIDNIRLALVNHTKDQNELYLDVIQSLQTLGGNASIQFGLLPFLRLNGNLIFDAEECQNSILLKAAKEKNIAEETFTSFINNFIEKPEAKFFNTITDRKVEQFFFLNAIKETGIKSYAVLPVFYNRKLAGILEVSSTQKLVFYQKLLSRLQSALPLIAQLLQYSAEQFDARINNVIKNHFTILQQPVEWRFNEAAWHYLSSKNKGSGKNAIETVSFHDVHPLYGAIDIRDSTIQHNAALKGDMEVLTHLLSKTVSSITPLLPLKIARSLDTKVKNWKKVIDKFEKSNDETTINNILQSVINPYITSLRQSYPAVAQIIDGYEQAVNNKTGQVYAKRRALELSIKQINSTLNRYFEKAQVKVQKIYPCYFEKFRSDGIEYDIYTGQSIAPAIEFTPVYLQQFREWQVRSLVEVANIANDLKSEMPVPLDVASLIFLHSSQIDICFRNDEKRFDVEGYYNVRYEVIKKRIDKVCIRDTGERLTQPGKISVVYFNDDEAKDYLNYIAKLQKEDKLLNDTVFVNLEDLQGVAGLKALRVSINYHSKA
jgi:hypothetical protein